MNNLLINDKQLPIYRFIANRGNTQGRNLYKENTIEHILNAINDGFNTTIDIWCDKRHPILYLGNETSNNKLTEGIFDILYRFRDVLWLNCQNIFALETMNKYTEEKLNQKSFNCFIRDKDNVIITTKGYIWNYSSVMIDNSIAVFPESYIKPKDYYLGYKTLFKNDQCVGICSDFVEDIRRISWEI